MGSMAQNDLDACRGVIRLLTNDKYKEKNFLFLHPFDLAQVPGYMDVVTKVMDLQTLSNNLESGVYADTASFFRDCFMIFENAIAYHGKREQTKGVAKMGREMLKIAKRQQSKLQNQSALGGGGGAGGGGKKSSVGLLPTKKNKKLLSEGGTKLKLKIGGPSTGKALPPGASAAAAPVPAAPAPAPSKPKLSLKLNRPSQGKVPPPGAQTTQKSITPPTTSTTEEKKPKKPRLTLKLGKSKDTSTSESKPKQTTTDKSLPTIKMSTTTPKSTTQASSATATTGKATVVGSGGSRGKELPEGVSPPKVEPKKSTTKKTTTKATTKTTAKTTNKTTTKTGAKSTTKKTTTVKSKAKADGDKAATPAAKVGTKSKTTKTKAKGKVTLKASLSSSSAAAASSPASVQPGGQVQMTTARKAQASKVLSGLKRRQYKNIGWFTQPVSDKAIIQDYRAKIKNPMDLNTMQTKLEKDEYKTVGAFVLDLRRIFANCLKYNTSIKDGLRTVAMEVLGTAEQMNIIFLAKPESPTQIYPPLLFCWKLCMGVMDTLNNLSNPADGQPTAYYFLHPVSVYCGGQFPPDYVQKVKKPMDFGTVAAKLIEGQYRSVDEFQMDCKLVLENCVAYYGGREDGKVFVEQANRLKDVLQQQLDGLNRYIKSPAGQSAQKQAQLQVTLLSFPKPPIPLLLSIIEEMRSLKYTDKATKITEPAMANFEKPVSTALYPDYLQTVKTPMDLQTVSKKVKAGSYANPEDFEYDMLLIFHNCIAYNGARKTDHFVSVGKYGMKHFRKIFANKMKAFDDPTSVKNEPPPIKDPTRKTPSGAAASQGPAKKVKLETGVSKGKTAGGKAAARPASTQNSTSSQAPKLKIPKPSTSASKLPKPSVPKNPNQPVPLHIAIAQVKEQFPIRRPVKSLQSWEAACARFFKELMRHPWISAARPKFLFHVPVPVLFPELKVTYAMKIKKPMDLTTVECKLLAGGRYATPEDFISDIALVFSNAIVFNKDGRDIGDPLSCAYYDASIHLLRYSRWLSLEYLSDYLVDSGHVDEPEQDGMPPSSWKLTAGNREKAREEMEAIVLKEPIEKSLEGDRFTWMEAECEKLLKALRHQSDARQMAFFLQPNYPPDYAAFISKPMDWEKCQKTLRKRGYDKSGDIIDDLRLIFSNALKYNARHAGTQTVSGAAFNAAKSMSAKLENAINKLMLNVSDRVERERIDHNNAEREIEAAERAEDERIRAQWKNENPNGDNGPGPTRVGASQRVRSTKRTMLSRENTDFEVPFFDDEDDGQHERSYFEVVRQQKAMFERQREELSKMQNVAANLGAASFLRSMQRDLALQWVAAERKKWGVNESPSKGSQQKDKKDATESSGIAASAVLSKLENSDRKPMKMKMKMKIGKPKPKKKVAPLLDFGGDDDEEE